MSFLSGFPAANGQSLFSSTSTQAQTLGSTLATTDGRVFRYVKNGAVAMVPGKLYQAAAQVTGDQNLAVAAAAIGATSVTTTSTVTVTANQYAGGYIMVTVTPGQGYMYRISSHAAATAAAVTLNLEDPILVALTTSSKIDLVSNPFTGMIVSPTTYSSSAVGVAVYPVAASEYGWLQCSGPTNVLADGTITVGTSLVASNGVAGAVEPATGTQPPIGFAITGIADTEYGAVMLTMF